LAASVSTVASTGPMQGVQPKAKASPMTKAPARLALDAGLEARLR
jgi:hypothetical protein